VKQTFLAVIFCTTTFNTPKFYVLPIQCIWVFCMNLKTKKQQILLYIALTGWVF